MKSEKIHCSFEYFVEKMPAPLAKMRIYILRLALLTRLLTPHVFTAFQAKLLHNQIHQFVFFTSREHHTAFVLSCFAYFTIFSGSLVKDKMSQGERHGTLSTNTICNFNLKLMEYTA